MARQPYLIQRDGTLIERATGQRFGRVMMDSGRGWTGYLLGPDFPQNPWHQKRVDAGLAGKRWSVARAVWNQHQKGGTSWR